MYVYTGVVLEGRCTRGVVSYTSEGRSFLVTAHACYDDHSAVASHLSDTTTPAPEVMTPYLYHQYNSVVANLNARFQVLFILKKCSRGMKFSVKARID